MHLHCCHQSGIVSRLTGNAMIGDQFVPIRKKMSAVSGNSTNIFLSRDNSTAACSTLMPKPFCSTGRVATTQLDQVLRNDFQCLILIQKALNREAGHDI